MLLYVGEVITIRGKVDGEKNSLMFAALVSFVLSGGRFQLLSIVASMEKWVYAVVELCPVFTTGPAQAV